MLVLLAGVLWFFEREIRKHWAELSREHLDITWTWIATGLVVVIVGYLLATIGWRKAIMLASGQRLTFIESVGLLNISQLTKYLPGKVWSYAIQMHLLASRGVPKTVVLSVNVIMLASLATSATMAGTAYLLVADVLVPREVASLLLAGSLAFYAFLMFGGAWSVNLLLRLANRFLGRQLAPLAMPLSGSLAIHGLFLSSNILFGISGYFVAMGIGMEHDPALLVPIAGSMLLSDTIGFLAFAMPGGIGIREGVMYAMLKSMLDIRICLMLPLAFRLVTTVSDLLLGGFALFVVNGCSRRQPASRANTISGEQQ
jgi:hypothetical protein